MEAKAISMKWVTLSLLAVLITEIAVRILLSAYPIHPMGLLGTARFIEILLVIQIARRYGDGVGALGLSRARVGEGLKRGLIWSAGFGFLTAAVSVILLGIGTNRFGSKKVPQAEINNISKL